MVSNAGSRLPLISLAIGLASLITVSLVCARSARDRVATDGGTGSVGRTTLAAATVRSGLRDRIATPARPTPPSAEDFEFGRDDVPVEECIARYRAAEARR